jgi:transposase InsO family protein
MPWKEATAMSLRVEFVQLAMKDGANISQLCRDFGISRKTGYKWLMRFQESGGDPSSLADRSRRPHRSPGRTPAAVEQAVLQVRQEHPAWGGRKIRAYLQRRGESSVPSPSTITEILRRQGQIDPEESVKHRPYQRFEMEAPNQLWQMDFKGYFSLTAGGYCHPLTVLDDHSRFLLGLRACSDERQGTVKGHLTSLFRQYGLPERMLMDNGSPWGHDGRVPFTQFSTWLIRLQIAISHPRPYHPQTLGKDERLHRSLKDEVLSQGSLEDLDQCQVAFDRWQQVYNYERPHEALGLDCPVSRYEPSPRPFPEQLPPVLYDTSDIVRKVDATGKIYFRNRTFYLSKAFRSEAVALRPTETDGDFDIYFCHQKVAQISLRVHND